MKIRVSTAALVLAAVFSSATVQAGIFGDSLAKCLVRSTSDGDKTVRIQWIFARRWPRHPRCAR